MRAETGRAVLAATAHLAPAPGGPPLSSLVGRVAAARGLSVVDGTGGVGPATPEAPSVPGPPAPPCPAAGRRGARPRALITPAPGLVTAPPTHRRLDSADASSPRTSGCALLAAHGGAGVSTLLRAGLHAAGSIDAQRRWPRDGPVLLVARTSTSGLEWARDAARQHASGSASLATELVGLVLIADAPGRLPARVDALAGLVCGAFARTWHVPWLEEWRLAAATEPLPIHPEMARLIKDLHGLNRARTTTGGEAL